MMSDYKFYTKKNENWGIFNNFVLHITKAVLSGSHIDPIWTF